MAVKDKIRIRLKGYDHQLVDQSAEKTDTAWLVIGRNSGGEECDRHLTEDYYRTETEEKLVKEVCTHFANVAVVLNVNGLIDLSWIGKYPGIKGLIFLGIPGEEGAGHHLPKSPRWQGLRHQSHRAAATIFSAGSSAPHKEAEGSFFRLLRQGDRAAVPASHEAVQRDRPAGAAGTAVGTAAGTKRAK